jgi:hypothetical protein
MKELIQEYKDAQEQVAIVYDKICKTSDGFIYITCLRSYGSIQWRTFINQFLTQELCNEFDGYDGIVDVYTNNPNNKIDSCGSVVYKSLEELQNLSKDNVSMTRAITNWMAKSY